MPIYVFKCNDCNKEFETLTKYDETEKYDSVECPHCQSKNKERQLHNIFFNGSTYIKENSHDYRFHSKQDSVREERKAAEAASKMGSNPYPNIDDISSGKHFGKVK